MRKFMSLVENLRQWPTVTDGWTLAHEAQDWHHTPEDFEDGDIHGNITAFEVYHLKSIPISSLHLGMFSIDDDLVHSYSEREAATAPPIIYDPVEEVIIDGNHRANAAAKRGDTEILAYVGDPSSYAPLNNEDEDEDYDD